MLNERCDGHVRIIVMRGRERMVVMMAATMFGFGSQKILLYLNTNV